MEIQIVLGMRNVSAKSLLLSKQLLLIFNNTNAYLKFVIHVVSINFKAEKWSK